MSTIEENPNVEVNEEVTTDTTPEVEEQPKAEPETKEVKPEVKPKKDLFKIKDKAIEDLKSGNKTLEEKVADLERKIAESENATLKAEKKAETLERLTAQGLQSSKMNFVKKYLLDNLINSEDLDGELESLKAESPELFKAPRTLDGNVPSGSTGGSQKLTRQKALEILNSKKIQNDYSPAELYKAINN